MVRLRGTVEITGGPNDVRKALRREKKAVLATLGAFWWRRYLPKHFGNAAVQRYHYVPRSVRYMIYKAKRWKHRRPLEFTGRMKEEVTRSYRLTSTSKSVRVVMNGPKYLYMYRKDYNQPDKAAELTLLLAEEEKTLNRLYQKRMTPLFKNLKTRTVRKIA